MKRAARVVGFEDLPYENAEVEQSTLFEDPPDRNPAFPFAEPLVPDVRMCRCIVRGRRGSKFPHDADRDDRDLHA